MSTHNYNREQLNIHKRLFGIGNPAGPDPFLVQLDRRMDEERELIRRMKDKLTRAKTFTKRARYAKRIERAEVRLAALILSR